MEEVRQRLAVDGFPADALVWREGFKNWQSFQDVQEFARKPTPAPPPLPTITKSPTWKRSLAYGAVIASVAVAYRVYSEYAGPRFEDGLQKLEADTKRTLPKKVDEITTLVDVKFERTKNIYWYVMDTKDGTIDGHKLEQLVRNNVCSNSEMMRTIKEKGFTYEYHYVNKEQVALGTFTIAKC